jgi:glycerol-3-phosphate dehydrogenase
MSHTDPTTGYRLWARIEHRGPDEFAVVVSAVPENGDSSLVRVLHELVPSREEAVALAKGMLQKMGEIVRRNEGHVIDVETDGLLD